LFEHFDDSTHFLVYCAPDSKCSHADGGHANPQRNRNLSGTEFLEFEQVVSLIVLHPHLFLRQLLCLVEDRLLQFSIKFVKLIPAVLVASTNLGEERRALVRESQVRGGTYSKFTVEPSRKYFVNVGSAGEPRDGNSLATYTIYNLSERSIRTPASSLRC